MKKIILKKNRLNKKGSQIGMILSFTIFALALFFIYVFFNPIIKIDTDKTKDLNLLEEKITRDIYEEVVIVNMNINETGNCYKIKNPVEVDSFKSAVVLNSEGENFSVLINESYTYFEGESKSNLSKLIYFQSESIGNEFIVEGDCLEIGIKNIEKKEIILLNNLLDLIQEREVNYTELKNSLAIEFGDEFNILFIDAEGETHGKPNKNLKTDIYSKEKLIEYYNLQGILKIGKLVVSLW